jgi:uncharacterized protein (TIGR00255 family)
VIKGMTGFGSSVFSLKQVKGMIEIKSQNHRYFDIAFYLPMGFAATEDKIRQILECYLHRGRVTLTLKITEKPVAKIVFNKEVIKEYLKHSKSLQHEFHLKNDLTLPDLVKLPGVVETRETFVPAEELWPTIEPALLRAVKSVVKMRTREGRSMVADMRDVLQRMSLQIKKIKVRTKEILSENKKIISDEEFVSFQKSCDINEELTRLAHFVEEFKGLLASEESEGKKLDFIAQEMQRETNTIGSKVQDKIVSNAVIALKSKIEKLREQSQNIE